MTIRALRVGLLLAGALWMAACGQSPAPNKSSSSAQAAASASSAPSTPSPGTAAAPASPPAAKTGASPMPGESLDQRADDKNESALERALTMPPAGNLPAGKWIAGQHYTVLSPAQPTNAAPGKVEVVEVFWYGCPHCYALESFLQAWLKTRPDNIEFVRMPVMWDTLHRAHARLYYTLQALGKADELHMAVFDEYHKNKKMLGANNDADTLKEQQAFAVAHGIKATDYANAFNSFTVQSKLKLADELTSRYRVDGVPMVVINGKYVSDVRLAGGQANLISLINDLAAAEKRR